MAARTSTAQHNMIQYNIYTIPPIPIPCNNTILRVHHSLTHSLAHSLIHTHRISRMDTSKI